MFEAVHKTNAEVQHNARKVPLGRSIEEYRGILFFFFFNGLERLEEWEIRKQKIIPHPAGQLI